MNNLREKKVYFGSQSQMSVHHDRADDRSFYHDGEDSVRKQETTRHNILPRNTLVPQWPTFSSFWVSRTFQKSSSIMRLSLQIHKPPDTVHIQMNQKTMLKHREWSSDSPVLGQDLRMVCSCNKFPGDADAADLGTTFEKASQKNIRNDLLAVTACPSQT